MRRLIPIPVLAAALLLGGASLAAPWSEWDQAAATYMADTILQGGTLYVDAWNSKAPGVYLTYALAYAVFGRSAYALRAFDLLWQLVTALVVAHLARRIADSDRAAAFAGAAYLAAYYATPFEAWAQPDGFLNLPLALGLSALLCAADSEGAKWWASAGAAVGAAAMYKLAFGFIGVAFLISGLLMQPRSPGRVLLRWAMLAAGLSVPLGACLAFLAVKGGLRDFLVSQFVLAPQFTERIRATLPLECIPGSSLTKSNVPLALLLAAGGISLIIALLRKEQRSGLGQPAILLPVFWLATAGLILVIHGVYSANHFIPLMGPAAVLSAAAFRPESVLKRIRWLSAALLILICLVPVTRSVHRAYWAQQRLAGTLEPEWPAQLAAHLRAHTHPDERIFVWGNWPEIYLLSERKSASRFIVPYFLWVRWRDVDFAGVFAGEMRRNPPRYIVVLKERSPGRCSGREIGAYEAFELSSAFREMVLRDYRVEHTRRQYLLYVREAGSARNAPGR